jgi:hypothetical protein
MRSINIHRIFSGQVTPALADVSAFLDRSGKSESISIINWKDFTGKPEAEFKTGYSDNEIFLKYYIREDCIKADMTSSNQRVYEDSCVEFFIAPDIDGDYYNFEFNCIGTCLLGVGAGREDRTPADPEIINKIRRFPSLGNMPFTEKKGDFYWTLTIAIPLSVLFRHQGIDFKNKTYRANFYKCGDKLSSPHYLTWNPVKTEMPDFHRPEFFGELRFI